MASMIKTSTHIVPREEKSILKMLPHSCLEKGTMIFLSNDCYKKSIIDTSYLSSQDLSLPAAKNFIQFTDDGVTSISLIQLYASDWVYLEYLCAKEMNYFHRNDCYIPNKILFITYDNEFAQNEVSVHTLMADGNASPIDCIMTYIPEFNNSLFFLTENVYVKLKQNTSTISAYRGMERLVWDSDDFYPGCNVMLHALGCSHIYFVENITFQLCKKNFSTKGFPNSIYFIII